MSVDALHENSHDVHASVACGRAGEFAPGDDAEHADVHQKIERSDDGNGTEDCARNGALRIAHFPTEETDVVVAPVVVG
jgi:hypothetical protein